MNPAHLLAHFDRISEAPDAIPRLRRFMLDLAVRGKLVGQDPRDEPAATLLGDRQLLPDPGSEPWTLPAGWAWSSYRLVGETIGGGTPSKASPELWNGSIPWVSPKDMKVDFIEDAQDHISAMAIDQSSARLIPAGSLLMVVRGMILAHSFPVAIAVVPVTINQDMKAVVPFCGDLTRILLLISKGMKPEVSRLVLRSTHGTCKLLTNDLFSLPLPIPPLAEQHRIVAKVDELMAICDRLEAAQSELESRRNRLAAASLHRLNQPADPDDSRAARDHARFYLHHLPRLAARPEHVGQLRQTILNLAVRGQLVTQDPNDEPAYELLKRIQMEKARLESEGKIAHQEPLIAASANELAFGLKAGWQAARISQILVELQTGPFGSSLHQSDYQKGGTPVINPASIKDGRLVPIDSMAVGPATLERLANFRLRRGDIVMGRRGEMGRCAVVTDQEDGWLCGTGSLILRLPGCVVPAFLATLIGSPFARDYLGGSAIGATMQNLNQSILLSLVIGLPPLPEQHRIVARVDEVMGVCDRLAAQLTTAQIESCCLLEAVLHHALEPAA